MNMFKDMQSNNQVERSVVEPHGLNVALIHVQTETASMVQRRVCIVQSPRLKVRVVLDSPEQVPLPAAELERANYYALGIETANPVSE
jgi:hypothetical protein